MLQSSSFNVRKVFRLSKPRLYVGRKQAQRRFALRRARTYEDDQVGDYLHNKLVRRSERLNFGV